MMQTITGMEIDALPSVCAGKRCTKDPAPGRRLCVECAEKNARKSMATLYAIGTDAGEVNIGVAKNVNFKLGNLRAQNAVHLDLLAWEEGHVDKLESKVRSLERFRVRGKWYDRQALAEFCEIK